VHPLPSGDQKLVQIVDAALADATRRSGHWLVCRPGCTQCCVGVFSISPLDALRLQHGLAELELNDAERATRVRTRAEESVARLAPGFPGDPKTGILFQDEASQAAFEGFGNEETCPALDPETGLCDLYSARPLTCRAFGPPVQTGDGLGVCELCFRGASDDQIAACEMPVDPDNLEQKLIAELPENMVTLGDTIVAFALVTISPQKTP
jgi:Fe-S-cluster containining protein